MMLSFSANEKSIFLAYYGAILNAFLCAFIDHLEAYGRVTTDELWVTRRAWSR